MWCLEAAPSTQDECELQPCVKQGKRVAATRLNSFTGSSGTGTYPYPYPYLPHVKNAIVHTPKNTVAQKLDIKGAARAPRQPKLFVCQQSSDPLQALASHLLSILTASVSVVLARVKNKGVNTHHPCLLPCNNKFTARPLELNFFRGLPQHYRRFPATSCTCAAHAHAHAHHRHTVNAVGCQDKKRHTHTTKDTHAHG